MKKIIFYNILILIILFLSFEIILRLFFDITPQGISKGIIDNESAKPRFQRPNLEKGKIFGKNIYTDENGFRISKKQALYKKKNENNENIYFVGGSVTLGSGVDQSETFSGILEENHKNINIHNASVMGSNIENNFYIIKNKIKKQKLKKIYVNFSLDDISSSENIFKINEAENFENENKKDIIYKLKHIPIVAKINIFFRSKSVIHTWIKGFIFDAELRYYTYELNMFKNPENINFLKKNMDLIKELNEEMDNKITFLVIPYRHQVNTSNCKMQDLAETIIERELLDRNFKFLKIKNLFCKDIKKNKIFLSQDPSHLSRHGHKILANYLANDIK